MARVRISRVLTVLLLLLPFVGSASGSMLQQDSTDNSYLDLLKKFYLKGYGVVNYYNYDWDTDPERRNQMDAERLNLYLGYHFNDWIEFKSEIEFEHGGTGSTMEFDKFEEFGEYEQKVEAGGEVLIEQMNVLFKIRPDLNVRVGRLKVYNGISSTMDDATEYFTPYRPEMENSILPLGWYENGIEVSGF